MKKIRTGIFVILTAWIVLIFLGCGEGPAGPANKEGAIGGDGSTEIDALLDALPPPGGEGRFLSGSVFDSVEESFPIELILSGGVPKDGIPALTNPPFAVAAAGPAYLSDADLVLGVVINGEAKAYPHNIGWRHEIVNDWVGGHPVAVTFCPLTGTGLVFDARDADGGHFELGVSGLLINTNLIMYDRRDGRSLYPQMTFTGVRGPRKREELRLLPVVETTWGTWKRLYPATLVVEVGADNPAPYLRYPYGEYRTDNGLLLFPLETPLEENPNPLATAYPAKDGMLGLRFAGEAKAYPFAAMGQRAVLNDEIGGVEVVVLWDQQADIAVPYLRRLDDRVLDFEATEEGFPFGLRDRQTGTRWNFKGEALKGPLAGRRLLRVPGHTSFWFAWMTFWPQTAVWQP
jgi:hypothetical protein